MNTKLAEYWANRADAELDAAEAACAAGNRNLQERHFKRANRCFQAEHDVLRGIPVVPSLRAVK